MSHSLYSLGHLSILLLLGCAHQQDHRDALAPDSSQTLVHGTWAIPIENADRNPAGLVERIGNEIRVSLAIENFEKPEFDRSGYWDQSGNYEHAYGGDRSGSFTWRFTGSEEPPAVVEVKARLSAESQTQGKPNETSDVTLFINGTAIGQETVIPDNGIGRFYVWRMTDPDQIRKLHLKPGADNELRFVVPPNARHQNGLCIYGKALDASAPEPGEPITIVYRLESAQ